MPYAKKASLGGKITTLPWDGFTGGIIALRTVEQLNVNAVIDATGKGYRGGVKNWDLRKLNKDYICHASAGDQGESFAGRGAPDYVTAGFGCCSGPNNMQTGYKGRGLKNRGGGGGGAGSCHGGGGAGGGHGDWSGVAKSPNACGHRGQAGDGSPECSRAGSWSQRGAIYGVANLKRLSLGSGGGGGNAHSPSEREDNSGGRGGGAILLDGGKEVNLQAEVFANGEQGNPKFGTSLCNWWSTNNPQDGSGGGGAGGSIHVMALDGKAAVHNDRMFAKGGTYGCDNGWRTKAQTGGAGGFGRLALTAKNPSGGARGLKTTRV